MFRHPRLFFFVVQSATSKHIAKRTKKKKVKRGRLSLDLLLLMIHHHARMGRQSVVCSLQLPRS